MDEGVCQRLATFTEVFFEKKRVHRAYVNLQKEKKDELENEERRTEEQRARMQREREELRGTLASSMFTDSWSEGKARIVVVEEIIIISSKTAIVIVAIGTPPPPPPS